MKIWRKKNQKGIYLSDGNKRFTAATSREILKSYEGWFTTEIKTFYEFPSDFFFLLKDKTNALVVLLLSFVFYLSKEVSPLTYRFILHWFTVITGGKFRPCSVQLNLYFSTKKKYSNCIPINSWTKREKSDYVIDCRENEVCIYA